MSQHDSKLQLDSKLVAVTVCAISNDIRVDVRQLYLTDDGQERPSQRGISISAHHVDRLIYALELARDGMVRDGYLLPRESFTGGQTATSGSISGSISESRVPIDYDIDRSVYPMSRW